MLTIENEFLSIGVFQKGAELRSLIDKNTGFQWIWQADDRFWGKSSPVLFPIVGALKENIFHYDSRTYTLSRHGFARDFDFDVIYHSSTKLIMNLRETEETKKCYPFDFSLILIYELISDKLEVSYIVHNNGDKNMYFSLGAHPAFNLAQYSESYIEFPVDDAINRYYLNNNFLSRDFDRIQLDGNRLFLNTKMFDRDAWVLKGLKSKEIYLKDKNTANGCCFSFEGFPYFGLWSVPGASFICLEPWAGLPDNEAHNQSFKTKEGIIHLKSWTSWSAHWTVQTIN